MLPNRIEHVLADFAAVHAGGVPVTLYATLAPEQIGYRRGTATPGSPCSTARTSWPAGRPVLAELPGLLKVIVRDAGACPAGSA